MRINRYIRGQVWWLKDNNPQYDGNVQGGSRPVIIVSNDMANRFSNNLTIIPCTSQDKKDLPTHIELEINGPSIALAEDIKTVSKERMGGYIGTCDEELINKIDNAMKIALGLECNCEQKKEYIKNNVTVNDILQTTSQGKAVLMKSGEVVDSVTKGPKIKYTLEDKIRFVNDYENHDKEYMKKKYNISCDKSLLNKVYLFRKAIKENS